MRSVCLAVLCASVLAGCNSSTPTAPTPPTQPVVTSPLPPVSTVVSISLLGDQWIPTNVAAPVQMTARHITSAVREPRASGDLVYPVSGIVRVAGPLVLEATANKPSGDELRVFNWSSTTNAGVTTMSGAFTKIEAYRRGFGTPYAIRTEHEFSGLSHTQ